MAQVEPITISAPLAPAAGHHRRMALQTPLPATADLGDLVLNLTLSGFDLSLTLSAAGVEVITDLAGRLVAALADPDSLTRASLLGAIPVRMTEGSCRGCFQ